jgi:hypothetical protein
METYGFPKAQWDAAKAEGKAILVARAKVRGMIPYSDFVAQLKTISLTAHDQRLFTLLGDISAEEDAAGRGMLSVVVVHKHGDMQPGPGFFELAGRLGRDTKDILKCWVDELRNVHRYWGKSTGAEL